VKPVRLVVLGLVFLLAACYSPADEKALNNAQALLVSGQAVEAKRAFHDFVRCYPDSKHLPRALLGLGMVEHLHLRDYEKALLAYRRLVFLFPKHETAPVALERMADIYANNLNDYPAAIATLQVLSQKYKTRNGRGDFYLERIGWNYFMMEEYDQAREASQRFLKKYPDSPLAERAVVRYADSYYVQNRTSEALKAYQEALERFPKGEQVDRIRFRMANCLEEVGRLEEARDIYLAILKTYDNPEAVKIRLAGVNLRLKEGAK